jgi:hypothetical protein
MFNNHEMSLVTDLGMIGPQINDKDFIAVAAITTSDYPNLPNIYNASILIPPTEILMAWADGDPYILQNQYPLYLRTQIPDEMIVALIALLTRKNVIMYIPVDEFNVFGRMFLDHIYYVYGLTLNTPTTRFSVDMTKIPLLVSKFYMIDAMDAEDLLATYPANAYLPDFVINKLAEELHPFNRPASFQEYAEYFNRLNQSKGTTILHPSMVKVVDKQ